MSTGGTPGTVIVGGGQAGAQVAATLRVLGYADSITIIESGECLPYERPPLTKAYLRGEVGEQDLALRPAQFWTDNQVGVLLGARVTAIDVGRNSVLTSTGRSVTYRNLVWAAGGRARQLPEASGITGVHVIRSVDDARRVREEMHRGRRAVVIGGGFIGLEAAAVLRAAGLSVVVVEAQDRLLARVTVQPVADHFRSVHSGRGVDIVTGVAPRGIESEHGRTRAVVLADGRRIPADLVVVGIGLVPETTALRDAGIACSDGVDVDARCRTSMPNIFAAGDCARRPNRFAGGRAVRLESVPNAVDQAKIVAAAIVGDSDYAETVPWFWSHQYDEKLQTAGLTHGYDDFIVRGSVEVGRFSVVYLRDGTVIALDCVNTPKDFVQGKALVAAGVRPDVAAVADPNVPLKALLPVFGGLPAVG